ncbi:MAG: DUF2203 domain-containing protein [Nanoarchaeota archaeon]|nr:DUF2203 domain-containing protein [Nanoarchaeota archaeon]
MTKINIAKQEFSKKYFTIEEAEELLPQIEKILRRTIRLNKALELLNSIEIEDYNDDYSNLRRITNTNKEFHKLSYEFYSNIEQLEDLGCIIKDLETGLVDFYQKFERRDILLCWKLGEKKIKFWHEIDTGFMGRKPILDIRMK